MDGHVGRNQAAFHQWIANEEEYFRWQSEKIELIRKILDGFPGKGVLADVGCFTGAATVLYQAAGFDRAVGFDVSPQALERAQARGIETRFWQAGEQACPAKDEEFDAIVAADVIEHIVETDAFMAELHRVLRPAARLILTTPNLAFWLSRLRLLLGRTPWSYPGPSPTVRQDIHVDLNHIRISTRREWEALFRARSFAVEAVQGWSILHALRGGAGIRLRQILDRPLTRIPDLAFGLLFSLRKS